MKACLLVLGGVLTILIGGVLLVGTVLRDPSGITQERPATRVVDAVEAETRMRAIYGPTIGFVRVWQNHAVICGMAARPNEHATRFLVSEDRVVLENSPLWANPSSVWQAACV